MNVGGLQAGCDPLELVLREDGSEVVAVQGISGGGAHAPWSEMTGDLVAPEREIDRAGGGPTFRTTEDVPVEASSRFQIADAKREVEPG